MLFIDIFGEYFLHVLFTKYKPYGFLISLYSKFIFVMSSIQIFDPLGIKKSVDLAHSLREGFGNP